MVGTDLALGSLCNCAARSVEDEKPIAGGIDPDLWLQYDV